MANYSRWTEVKDKRPAPSAETRAGIDQDLALGQLIYDLRTDAGLSQRALAERMGTTQSVISRLEEGMARDQFLQHNCRHIHAEPGGVMDVIEQLVLETGEHPVSSKFVCVEHDRLHEAILSRGTPG